MNRNKSRLLSALFSCFIGVFAISNAFGQWCIENNPNYHCFDDSEDWVTRNEYYYDQYNSQNGCCARVANGTPRNKTIVVGPSLCQDTQQLRLEELSDIIISLGSCRPDNGFGNLVYCTETISVYHYTCEQCTLGTYTGPNGDTFCCDKAHLDNILPDTGGHSTIDPEAASSSGGACVDNGNGGKEFVCNHSMNSYYGTIAFHRLRLIDKDAVSNADTGTLANRRVQGYDRKNYTVKPNYVCLPAFGSYPQRPSGYDVEDCGSVGYGPNNNTTFANCKIFKKLSQKTGCVYDGTNNIVKETRKLNTNYNYGNPNYDAYAYDKQTRKFYGYDNYTNDGQHSISDLENWTNITYNFQAQPGYYKGTDSCVACPSNSYSKGGNIYSCNQCPYDGGYNSLIAEMDTSKEGMFIGALGRLFVGALGNGTQTSDVNHQYCSMPASNIARISGTYTNAACTFEDANNAYYVSFPHYLDTGCFCDYAYEYGDYSGCMANFVRALEYKMDAYCRGESECGLRFFDDFYWPEYYNATSAGDSDNFFRIKFNTLYDAQRFVSDVVDEFDIPVWCLDFSIESQ